MNYQDMATKFWELHKADEFPSHAQMIGIRLFADWLEEEIDSESDEPKKKTRDEMLAESEGNYKCFDCGTDCTTITCPAEVDEWDDLIEETDYLEEDDE